MNHLQLQQAALPDLSESQISRLPKDQLVHFSNAVQQLNDWTLQMRGRINRAMEIRYADQIRHAESLGQEEAARFRIDDLDGVTFHGAVFSAPDTWSTNASSEAVGCLSRCTTR